MKTKTLVATLKIYIENPTVTGVELASIVEDAIVGDFGHAMWKCGTFANAYVSKVKEEKRND